MITTPHKNYFDIASKYRILYKGLFWLSVVLSIVFTKFKIEDAVNWISIFSLVSLLSIDRIIRHYAFKAEETRRMDFFDNSFGTHYSHISSSEYYDTDEILNGPYKMIANTFESSLFTMEISSRMKNSAMLRNLLFFFVIVGFAIYGFSRVSIAIPLLQLFLSKDFVVELLDLHFYNNRVENIFNDLKKLFDRGLVNNQESVNKNLSEIIRIYMEYETNISDMKIQLSSKVYNSMNQDLTKEWERMKEKYSIK